MIRKYLFLFLVELILAVSIKALSDNQKTVICTALSEDCNSCIQAFPFCYYCYDHQFKYSRCNVIGTLRKQNCAHIENNDIYSQIKSIEKDKEFNDVTNPKNLDEAVQIKPQRFKMQIRPGEKLTFEFKYRMAKNYPLDLYYLTDLTLTMQNDVAMMASLGKKLAEMLQNLTTHYKVAFGYYSDKVTYPYSSTVSKFLENPCAAISSEEVCVPAFDFIHQLNFTDQIQEFVDKARASKTTLNLDNLEGGSDALMQIILCQDHIQWRKNSRKIVVVASDSLFHFAGDGILGGATVRNTKECALDSNGVYTKSLKYDYPSLEEIYRNLLEYKMNVLFAAKEEALNYYQRLNALIPEVSFVGKLSQQSENVLNLVRDGYYNVVRNVKFEANNSDALKMTFESNCNKPELFHHWNVTSSCDNVVESEEYVFKVTLETTKMPNEERETVVIEEQNIAEQIIIDIDYVGYKCKCENENVQRNCSGKGSFKCGKCECNEGQKGDNCERSCERDFTPCKSGNHSAICSERGTCDCGECICDDGYDGPYCEFKQCLKNKEGLICSGQVHGLCVQEKCICHADYTGKDCSCAISQRTCIAPGDSKVCSGIGNCICGKCACDYIGSVKYTGNYCEKCPTCEGLCKNYEDCVKTTVTNNSSTSCNSSYNPKVVEFELKDESKCFMRAEIRENYYCDLEYTYNILRDSSVDIDIHKLSCWEPVAAGFRIGLIIGAIVALGVIGVLIWKLKNELHYRREFAAFQKNLEGQRTLDENPLYRSPITNYQNPMEMANFRDKVD